MALRSSDIQFRNADTGVLLTSGRLNNLFPNAVIGGTTTYRALEVRNTHDTLTLSNAVAWVTQDTRGGEFAIAFDSASGVVAIGTPWNDSTNPSTLTYSAPTTLATGIALGHLTYDSKVRLYCRRIVSSATAATPENNRVWVGGTSPL